MERWTLLRTILGLGSLLVAEAKLSFLPPILGDLCHRDNPCVDEARCVIDPAAPFVGRPFCVCPNGNGPPCTFLQLETQAMRAMGVSMEMGVEIWMSVYLIHTIASLARKLV